MLKSALIFSLLCLSGFIPTPFANAAITPEPTVTTGTVQFTRHRTLTPFVICENLPGKCPQSKPYWTVVVTNDEGIYEWNEPQAMGRESAPESIDFGGLTVHPGSRVHVEGTIERVSSGHAYITDIREISEVPDGFED